MPTAPLAGGDDASHKGMQIAGDRTPSSHTLGPDTAYPWSHVGWHVDPLASSEVQSPTAPLAGGDDASQGGTYLENTYADPLLVPCRRPSRPDHHHVAVDRDAAAEAVVALQRRRAVGLSTCVQPEAGSPTVTRLNAYADPLLDPLSS